MLNLTPSIRITLVTIAFSLAILGFMVKLPSVFHRYDKILHAAFYFSASAFVHIVFSVKKMWVHVLIAMILLLFGICIEHTQAGHHLQFPGPTSRYSCFVGTHGGCERVISGSWHEKRVRRKVAVHNRTFWMSIELS